MERMRREAASGVDKDGDEEEAEEEAEGEEEGRKAWDF